MFDLRGKVAVVTGATGLLGKEHCRALSEAGAQVVVTDLGAEACEEQAAELSRKGPAAFGVAADVTKKESLEALLSAVLKKFDRLDVLVNNAAINDMFENPQAQAEQSKFENYPLPLWQRSLDVNVTGVFLCCQVLGQELAKRRSGSIINIASTYGIVAPDQSIYRRPDGEQSFYKSIAYPATKGAVISMTRFLAAYWGQVGVRVNALSPGGVENHQDPFFIEQYAKRTPLGRMANAKDYKGALVFLASDASSYMTGANLVVDGGWTAW